MQPFLVGDEWVKGGGAPLTSVNPANGQVNCEIATASAADVDRAVRTAEAAQIGPMASFAHRDRVEALVAQGRAENGEVILGGGRPSEARLKAGAFYSPTIFTGLDMTATICREEIFGMRLYQQVKSRYWNLESAS